MKRSALGARRRPSIAWGAMMALALALAVPATERAADARPPFGPRASGTVHKTHPTVLSATRHGNPAPRPAGGGTLHTGQTVSRYESPRPPTAVSLRNPAAPPAMVQRQTRASAAAGRAPTSRRTWIAGVRPQYTQPVGPAFRDSKLAAVLPRGRHESITIGANRPTAVVRDPRAGPPTHAPQNPKSIYGPLPRLNGPPPGAPGPTTVTFAAKKSGPYQDLPPALRSSLDRDATRLQGRAATSEQKISTRRCRRRRRSSTSVCRRHRGRTSCTASCRRRGHRSGKGLGSSSSRW